MFQKLFFSAISFIQGTTIFFNQKRCELFLSHIIGFVIHGIYLKQHDHDMLLFLLQVFQLCVSSSPLQHPVLIYSCDLDSGHRPKIASAVALNIPWPPVRHRAAARAVAAANKTKRTVWRSCAICVAAVSSVIRLFVL